MKTCIAIAMFIPRRAAPALAGGALLLAATAAAAGADLTLENRVVTTPMHVFTVDDTGLPAQVEIRAAPGEIPLAWRAAKEQPAALLKRLGRGPQLAGPLRLEAVVDKAPVVAKADAPAVLQQAAGGVEATAAWQAGALKGRLRVVYAADGSLTGELAFDPKGVKLERLELALELTGPVDTAIAGNPAAAGTGKPLPAGYGSLDERPGVVWLNGKTPAGDGGLTKGRVTHFFLGNGDRGFTWLAPAAEGFAIGDQEPSVSVERRPGGTTLWRLAVVNTPPRGGLRTASFTLLTHPSRLPVAGRRLLQWQPWPEKPAVPEFTAAARGKLEGDLVRADAGSVAEAVAARALLAGPAGGDARSAAATLADSFPIGVFRYFAGRHTALAAQLRSNAAALVTPGAAPAADRMTLGRALLHDIGVDLSGLAGRVRAAAVVEALEAFGYFADDGQTEFLPYWRTDGILRYGEDFGAEAKKGFAVTAENPAGRTRVSVFLRPATDAEGNPRRKALFVVVNEGDRPVREHLYLADPVYLFGGLNKVTVPAVYGQLAFTHLPAVSDWRRNEVLKSLPDIDKNEIKAKVPIRSQRDRSEQANMTIGQLLDLETGGYVQTTKQGADFAVCGPVFVPARGLRLLFGSGAEPTGVVGSVYQVAADGTRTPVSVPVHIYGGRGLPVADKLEAIPKPPLAKLKSAADGSFRCVLSSGVGEVTVIAEIEGKLYPDLRVLTKEGSVWPAMALVGNGNNGWTECVIEALAGATPNPKVAEGPAAPVAGQPWTAPVTGMAFVWIPPGKFTMGSPDTEPGRSANETLHQVTLTKGFWLGKHEVTQGQWKRVMGYNPSHFKYAGDNAPVENLSWGDCQLSFIPALNAIAKGSGVRYRLPTEAEWEYACRAGTQSAIYTGPLTIKGALNGPELDAIAWYGGNSGVNYPWGFDTSHWRERQYEHPRSGTHPVGEKKPNAWGLYDMLGNVSEWCQDMCTILPADPVTDPVVIPEPDKVLDPHMVVRGGEWYRLAAGCRAAYRQKDLSPHGEFPPPTDNYVGCRLACELEQTAPAPPRAEPAPQ